VPADTLRALLDWLNVDDRKSEALIVNLEVVKDYYGKVLKSSKDLKTSACCDGGAPGAS